MNSPAGNNTARKDSSRDVKRYNAKRSGREFTSCSLRPVDGSRTCTGRRFRSDCWGRRTSAGWSTPWGGRNRRSSKGFPRCSLRGHCSASQTTCEKRDKKAVKVLVREYSRPLSISMCADSGNLLALFRLRVASSKRLLLPRGLWKYRSPQARPQRARSNSETTRCILKSQFGYKPSLRSLCRKNEELADVPRGLYELGGRG